MRNAYKFYPGAVIDKVFDPETSMSMSTNMMVLPHVCLIIRNIEEWAGKTQLDLKYFSVAGVIVTLVIRYGIKTLFLRKGLKLIKRTATTSQENIQAK